jgi:hypothetical protein
MFPITNRTCVGLHSSGALRSLGVYLVTDVAGDNVTALSPRVKSTSFFLDWMILEHETYRLSRKVGKQIPIYTA